jgi:hypothetical protein
MKKNEHKIKFEVEYNKKASDALKGLLQAQQQSVIATGIATGISMPGGFMIIDEFSDPIPRGSDAVCPECCAVLEYYDHPYYRCSEGHTGASQDTWDNAKKPEENVVDCGLTGYHGIDAPDKPDIGDLWIDDSRGEFKVYDGKTWVPAYPGQGYAPV